MMKMSKVWDIMREFKDSCRRRGWKTSESEDWVNVGEEYHSFVLAKEIHPASFKKMAANRKCVISEGLSYRVVEAAYTAWLFSESPSETLLKAMTENHDLANKVALYDLSPVLEGRNTCIKLNCTESPVFRAFENFLKNKINVELKPLAPISASEVSTDNFRVVQLA